MYFNRHPQSSLKYRGKYRDEWLDKRPENNLENYATLIRPVVWSRLLGHRGESCRQRYVEIVAQQDPQRELECRR